MPKRHLRKTAAKKALASNANCLFTPEEQQAMAEPHSPECFLVCCIDSRFQPAKALDYGPGIALEYRQIACAVPPEASAGPDLMARLAFRRLNNIGSIVLVTHTDCGGAQAALKVPQPDFNGDDDLHAVAAVVHRTGLNIPVLGADFLRAEEGSLRKAGDRLARAVGVKAFNNLMGYKGREGYATIADEVKAGALDVKLLHYDLERQSFEIYSPLKGKWEPKKGGGRILGGIAKSSQACAHETRRAKVKASA